MRPKDSVWEPALKIRAKEKKFTQCVDSTVEKLASTPEEFKHSPILETLRFVANVLKADGSQERRLVIYSDMAQNTPTLAFIGKGAVESGPALQVAEKQQLVPELSGVTVAVAGAGVGVPDDKARKIEDFWRKLFEKSGAKLTTYGPLVAGL